MDDPSIGALVVTGAGLLTAAGDTPHAAFAAIAGRRPLASVRADDGLHAAAIQDFDVKRYLDRKGVRDLSRTSQLACSAAAANARGLFGVAAEDVGVVLGSAWGSLSTVITFEREAHLQGARFVDPILFTETVSNVPAGQVAILHGWSAFNATVSSGSASGLAGLRQALAFLEEGRGEVAVAGGADEINWPLVTALQRRAGSAGTSGAVMGEGACFLTIESGRHAGSRGARPLASILASGCRFAPSVAPATGAAREALTGLLRELTAAAGLAPREVDIVVISAGGSSDGDVVEAESVIEVFGEGESAPPVMAPKSIFGATWGASGPLAVVLAIEAMRSSTAPAGPVGGVPPAGFERLHVPRETLHRPLRNALILDRTDTGYQLGMLLSVAEPHDLAS